MQTNRLKGTLAVPGDKSISHRSIIFGAISNGTTHVHNFLESADCLSTIKAFRQMGVQIDNQDQEVTITSQGINALTPPQDKLDMGNSGTTTRLISGLLAGQPFTSHLFGDQSLSKRPMKRIIDPLTKMGAQIESNEHHLPMTIHGGQLHGINYQLPMPSAQVKSSIILAALNADGDTTIIEPIKSRDHTERILQTFSPASIEQYDHKIIIHPHQAFHSETIEVPGDISSAAFFLVAAAIVPDSEVTLKNVGINPTRTGILEILKTMGADIQINPKDVNVEPSADITVRASSLKPFQIGEKQIPGLVDEVPLLALLAARADGVSQISGAEELRFKESDRLKAIATEFKKLGIDIQEKQDGFIINGRQTWHVESNELNSYKDHRIAMTLKIASLLVDRPVTIKDFDCIRISYPTFSDDLAQLRS